MSRANDRLGANSLPAPESTQRDLHNEPVDAGALEVAPLPLKFEGKQNIFFLILLLLLLLLLTLHSVLLSLDKFSSSVVVRVSLGFDVTS